ncbi:Cadherin-4 [Bienertia sinuspersici]
MLKPWQLYSNKQHIRDVVRDYYIQNSFAIVVDRADNHKYSVICSEEGYPWRIHASRLPEGITWAIKSITGSEHTCLVLQTQNPMVSAKWATRVLLEDITESNEISAKTLNKLI